MSKNNNKKVTEELTPLNVLGVSPPPCPTEGGLWVQYTLEHLLGLNLLLPCEKTHESCLLKSLSASWILTTFFSEETWPLVVMLKFKSWMRWNIMTLSCQNDKAIHPWASDWTNFFSHATVSPLPCCTSHYSSPHPFPEDRESLESQLPQEAKGGTKQLQSTDSHFTQAQWSQICFAE